MLKLAKEVIGADELQIGRSAVIGKNQKLVDSGVT